MLSRNHNGRFPHWLKSNYPLLFEVTNGMSYIEFCDFVGFDYKSCMDKDGKFVNEIFFFSLAGHIQENYETFIKFRLL